MRSRIVLCIADALSAARLIAERTVKLRTFPLARGRWSGPKRWGRRAVVTGAATGLLIAAGVTAAHADTVSLSGCDPAIPGCAGPYAVVNIRLDPNTSEPPTGQLSPGQIVGFCQVLGQDIKGNSIWDLVGTDDNTGGPVYVSDYYMNTPSFGTNMVAPC